MGQIHNELRRTGLSVAFQAAVGDTRQGGIERYGETLMPLINLWGLPEWAFLRREKMMGVSRFVAAGAAATFAAAALANTSATPRLLVVVEAVSASATGTGDAVDLYLANDADIQAAYGSNQRGQVRDTRFQARASEAVVRYGAAALPTLRGPLEQLVAPSTLAVPFVTSVPLVLNPGQAVVVVTENDAANLNVSFGWRERVAYPGEIV